MSTGRCIKRKAIQALFIELLGYCALGVASTLLVTRNLDLPYGPWPVVLLIGGLSAMVVFGKYIPNIRAHDDMVVWLGDKYLDAVNSELKTKSLRNMISRNWFVEHHRFREQTEPSRMRKFMN
jgi:hypothetical protein